MVENIEKISFFIFIFSVALFIIGAAVIAYHFEHFSIQKGRKNILISILTLGTIALLLVEFVIFFNIDWPELIFFIKEQIPDITPIIPKNL